MGGFDGRLKRRTFCFREISQVLFLFLFLRNFPAGRCQYGMPGIRHEPVYHLQPNR